MKAIPAAETFHHVCSGCGCTLVISYDDVADNMHDGGYYFNCCQCGKYHPVAFKDLPRSIRDRIARWETGH